MEGKSRLNFKTVETLEVLTKYEKARIIGTRAAQIENGMLAVYLEKDKDGKKKVVPFPEKYDKLCKNSVDVAKVELMTKSSPLIIERPLPDGTVVLKTIQEL